MWITDINGNFMMDMDKIFSFEIAPARSDIGNDYDLIINNNIIIFEGEFSRVQTLHRFFFDTKVRKSLCDQDKIYIINELGIVETESINDKYNEFEPSYYKIKDYYDHDGDY